MLAAVAIFLPYELPHLYLIEATVWNQPNTLFVSHDYGEGKISKPEWGLNLSQKNMPSLAAYSFERTATQLRV